MPSLAFATAATSAVAIFTAGASGLSHREAQMASNGPLSHVRAIIITMDPSAFRFRLALARKNQNLDPAWNIDSIPRNAVVAVNAGQFIGGFPWGWLVRDGVETLPPGKGTLGMALVIDSSERVSLITPDEIAASRSKVLHAFQSYPALLVDGELPWELQREGRGVDLTHRDSRLAICTRSDGEVTIVLTRVTALGNPGATLPYGPTVPEMAQYMRTLGCRRAMMLDGGISSQLAIRDRQGKLKRWTNWRMVPLGLVAFPRN